MERYALYHIQTKDQREHLVVIEKYPKEAISALYETAES